MHNVEPLHGNSPTDIELILVLREPFGLLYPPKKIFSHLVQHEVEKNLFEVGKNDPLYSDFDHVQFHSYHAPSGRHWHCFRTPGDL